MSKSHSDMMYTLSNIYTINSITRAIIFWSSSTRSFCWISIILSMSFPYAVPRWFAIFHITFFLQGSYIHPAGPAGCDAYNPACLYNKSYFLLLLILFILKFSFLDVFFTDSLRHQKTRSWMRVCASGVLSFIPINDLAACCCWRRWSFLPRDSRWADGRIFSAFQIFTNRLYTYSFFFLFCISDETSLPVILPASTQQRSNNNSAKKITLIYTQVDICVHSRRTPLIHR